MRQVEEREHAEAGEAQRHLPELHSRQGAGGAAARDGGAGRALRTRPGRSRPPSARGGAGRGGRGPSRAVPPSAPQVGFPSRLP